MSTLNMENNIIVERDYSDNFAIKDTAINKFGTKYFEDIELSGLNVGELGFVLEQIANITEDAFNTASVLINEAFPNKAVIPESIYSHAAIFQLDNVFANCAKCLFMMLLRQEEIIKYGETDDNNQIHFYIDKKLTINVEDIPFTLDYDIHITAKQQSNKEYLFTAKYDMNDDINSISNISEPYIAIRKITDGNLFILFTAHQVERTEIDDIIINNTKINYPMVTCEFENTLAGFDIYYKPPTSSTYTQLKKQIKFSVPLKSPFCYYRLKNSKTLEISFSTRDGYFQPEFNSQLKIIIYTTLGSKGNFEVYNGSNIEINTCSEKYEYNQHLTIASKPVSASLNGTDRLSDEALQALTIESYSTVNEIATENDITTYFYNYKYRYGNEILVLKMRDDITERLFSSFLLLKNDDYIYPTNTTNININISNNEYDLYDKTSNKYIINPGHIFVYEENSNNTLKMIPNTMIYENDKIKELENENTFIYTNPFLITIQKSPNLVGFYKTIANQNIPLSYSDSNDNSFIQFISTQLTITRGLTKAPQYKLSTMIMSTLEMSELAILTGSNKIPDVRVIVGFLSKNGEEIGYIELNCSNINDSSLSTLYFEGYLEGDDDVRSDMTFGIIARKLYSKDTEKIYIPINNTVANVYILYHDASNTSNESNKFINCFDDMDNYVLTNIYTTKTNTISFIEPLNLMRSNVIYSNIGTDDSKILNANLSMIPVIKASLVYNDDIFNTFIEKFTNNYNYLKECLPRLRNNTHLDIKFYNSYGKSVNYYIGDNKELIDKVNIKITFYITLVNGADDTDIKDSLKSFIKQHVEKINSSGNNDLYISNLIREMESNFPSIHHMRFIGINEYSTDYQTISVKTTNIDDLSKNERRNYVPEVLVVDKDDILLSIN